MKKFSFLLSAGLFFTWAVFGVNYIGPDNKPYVINEQFLESANFLAEKGYIVNNSEALQKYRLDNTITRSELIGIALKIGGIELPDSYQCKNYYSDVAYNSQNNWICRAIEIAADNKIITRNNIYFRPGDNITNSEALAILMRVKNIKYDKDIASSGYKEWVQQWQIDLLEWAIKHRIIQDYDVYWFWINAPAIRWKIFGLAIKTMVASGDVEDMWYHYLSWWWRVYHNWHELIWVESDDFRLIEGDFFTTKNSVYKSFGCTLFNGCGENSIMKLDLDPKTVQVVSYHYIRDEDTIWNCSSGRCKKINSTAWDFACVDQFRLCGNGETVYDQDGWEVFSLSHGWDNSRLVGVYYFLLSRAKYDSAEKLVVQSALKDHQDLVSRLKKPGSSFSGYWLIENNTYLSLDVTIDQELWKIESIYIWSN